jgi:hypothetical protein
MQNNSFKINNYLLSSMKLFDLLNKLLRLCIFAALLLAFCKAQLNLINQNSVGSCNIPE